MYIVWYNKGNNLCILINICGNEFQTVLALTITYITWQLHVKKNNSDLTSFIINDFISK